jgi:hypothetical protein
MSNSGDNVELAEIRTIPSLVAGDQAKVLRLGFSALSHASADTALNLMRSSTLEVRLREVSGMKSNAPNAFVTLLQLNCDCIRSSQLVSMAKSNQTLTANRIADAVPAPSRSHLQRNALKICDIYHLSTCTHARFDGPKCLSIGMSALKAGMYEFLLHGLDETLRKSVQEREWLTQMSGRSCFCAPKRSIRWLCQVRFNTAFKVGRTAHPPVILV